MTDHREVMRQALEYMDWLAGGDDPQRPHTGPQVREALRAAIDAPEGDVVPVAHAIVAGALYDFMGWLTTRDEPITLSAIHWASPAVDAIVAFADMRGLNIDNPRIAGWQHIIAHPPTPPQDADTVTVRLTREQHKMLTRAFDGYASLSPWKKEMLALLGTFPDAACKYDDCTNNEDGTCTRWMTGECPGPTASPPPPPSGQTLPGA